VFCEDPTYFIALNIFRIDFKLPINSVCMQEDGINIDYLEDQIKSYEANCKDYQYIFYTIPMYNNPTGVTMSNEKRGSLAKLATKYPNLTVIADEVYQMLSFETELNTYVPMYFWHENFISVGSMSKIFSPALRLGWIHANKLVIKVLDSSGQMDSGGCVNPIGCAIMERVIKSGNLLEVKNKWRKFLEANCDKLYNKLIETFGDKIEIIKPTGGYFLWCKIKSKIPIEEIAKAMENFKVKFHYGNKFSANKQCDFDFRLSFSWYFGNDLDIGVQRLKQLFDSF